jgi:hypothetical protein
MFDPSFHFDNCLQNRRYESTDCKYAMCLQIDQEIMHKLPKFKPNFMPTKTKPIKSSK